jgi:hypothetical protein
MKTLILITALIIFAGCSTLDPTAGRNFDPKSKVQCLDICKEADMTLQSLVVVGGMAGCVCGMKGSDKSSSVGGAIGGALAVVLEEKAQEEQAAIEAQKQNKK